MAQAQTVTPRRTAQAAKSASTRIRILDAAIECLVEIGYARTTTIEIAGRAGVSRGAMLHHYKSKAEILYAAMEFLHEKRLAFLRGEVAKFTDDIDVVEVAVNLFWESAKHPYYYAMHELTVAARTDAELRQSLLPLSERFDEQLMNAAIELFSGYVAPSAPFAEMRDLARYLFDGLAMARILHQNDEFAERTTEFLKQLIRDLLLKPELRTGSGA